jgi:hypothetical protein
MGNMLEHFVGNDGHIAFRVGVLSEHGCAASNQGIHNGHLEGVGERTKGFTTSTQLTALKPKTPHRSHATATI